MLYLTSGSGSLNAAPDSVGSMVGPRQGGIRPVREGRKWAGDNDAFHGKFTEAGFLKHLTRLYPFRENCLFVAAPDVVADPAATAELFAHWGPRIRDLGFPVAWVAQNGATPADIPDCDAVFIGGGTEWKLSEYAHAICQEAKRRGLWVHIGRVNSEKRCITAALMGADSVDGTHMTFSGIQQAIHDFTIWTGAARAARDHQRLFP